MARIRLIVTGRELAMGYTIPRWWGKSYRMWNRDAYIIHPVPINLIVRYSRNFWHWVIAGGSPSRLDEVFYKGHSMGTMREQARYEARTRELENRVDRLNKPGAEYERGWNAAFKYMEDELAKRQH